MQELQQKIGILKQAAVHSQIVTQYLVAAFATVKHFHYSGFQSFSFWAL